MNNNRSARRMLKIKDLLQESNLKSSSDLIAIIAKVGELKLAPQTSTVTVAAREVYLYDDSWAMIKLIVRDHYAKDSQNYKADEILFLKNIKPMKLRSYIVLATIGNTFLSIERNTPEAMSLRSWFDENVCNLQAAGFKQLLNLSVPSDATAAGQPRAFGTNGPSALERFFIENRTVTSEDKTKSTSNVNCNEYEARVGTVKTSNDEPSSKIMRVEPSATVLKSEVSNSESIMQKEQPEKNTLVSASQPANTHKEDSFVLNKKQTEALLQTQSNTKESMDEVINILSDDDDENNEMPKQEEHSVKLEKIDNENDDIDHDITDETFNTLMTSLVPVEEWNEEKDRYLINFVSKNCTKLQCELTYAKLLEEKPHIFEHSTSDMLKQRTEVLASVENYVYLTKLCGGGKIKSEKEKNIFIEKVDRLRRLMRPSIKEECKTNSSAG